MWLFALIGCGGEEGCDPSLSAGGLEATVDGDALTAADAAFRLSGDALQINASAGESSFSIVLQESTDGTPASQAEPPFSVDLGEEGGGWIVFYPPEGDSRTTGTPGGSGTLEVAANEDTLSACFSGVMISLDPAESDISGEFVASAAP